MSGTITSCTMPTINSNCKEIMLNMHVHNTRTNTHQSKLLNYNIFTESKPKNNEVHCCAIGKWDCFYAKLNQM